METLFYAVIGFSVGVVLGALACAEDPPRGGPVWRDVDNGED